MDNGSDNGSSILRLIGVMGIGVGVAWALQIFWAGSPNSPVDQLMWILAAASVCGASFGFLLMAGALEDRVGGSRDLDVSLS